MRILLPLLAISVATFAGADQSSGTYKSGSAAGTPWQINAHQTLMWDGAPYIPVGVAVDPTPASISAAKAAGIQDVIVDLPAGDEGWADAISALESAHLRYLIRIGSLCPMARGYAVDPASYRITSVTAKRHLDIPLFEASEALVVVAQRRDGSVEKWDRVPVSNGHLVYDVNPPAGIECVVLVYPNTVSLEQPDYWEKLDSHRDRLLTTLRRHPPGPGLRGFVNPMGKTLGLPGRNLRFVPADPAFRSEFATFLEGRYRNVVSTLRSWSVGSEITSAAETGEGQDGGLTFRDVAAFVPLWSGSRGIPQVWDPVRNRLITCDSRHSALWKDLSDAVGAAESRRYQRMVAAIRSAADVPVVQEWQGWSAPYETTEPSVDGIGMRASGSTSAEVWASGSTASSSILRWPTPGWLPATDVELESADRVSGDLDDLTTMGARGVFFKTANQAAMRQVAEEHTKRGDDPSAAQYAPTVVYFPINAMNPAEPQRLRGGALWLPTPADGDRLDFGPGYYGYRMGDAQGQKTVIWAKSPQRVLLRLLDPKKVVVTTVDGSSPDPKITKTGLLLNLSDSPLTLTGTEEVPVPEPAYNTTLAEIEGLLKQSEDQHRDLTEIELNFSDKKESFERNPSGAFIEIRHMVHQLNAFLGKFSWWEAESTEADNFSETVANPTCSGGRALALHGQIDPPEGFFADYTVPVKSQQDLQVWLAARIAPEDRSRVQVKMAGQVFSLTGEPVGLYGSGYGWYHIGVTRLLESIAKIRIQVLGTGGDMSFDTLLLAPSDFQPNGIYPPESPPLPAAPGKKKPARHRGSPVGSS